MTQQFTLTPPGEVPVEQLESFQRIRDTVLECNLDAATVLGFLAATYRNEAVRLDRTFFEAEMPAAMAFAFQKRIREVNGWARALTIAAELYFCPGNASVGIPVTSEFDDDGYATLLT